MSKRAEILDQSTDTSLGLGTLSLLRTLGLLSLGLLLLAYVGVAAYQRQEAYTDAEVRLDRATRIAQEHALKVFDTNETMLARVMDAVGQQEVAALKARESQLHQQMLAMSRNKPQIQSMWVLGPDGRPVATDRSLPAPADLDVSDRDYFQWHRAHRDGLFVSGILKGRATGTRFFDMSRGRYLADGRFAGVVSVSLSPEYFEAFHKELVAHEPGLAITMVRDDGAVLTRSPNGTGNHTRLDANSVLMTAIRSAPTDGRTNGISPFDGRERMFKYRKIGDYPVYVAAGIDLAEVQSRWLSEMGLIAAVGLPALVGFFFTGRAALRRTRESLQTAEQLKREATARRKVEAALLQAQKLEALGRLTGGVAHDFNNALMIINTNLALIKLKFPQVAERQLEAIGTAVKSATQLTRQLLAFSRRQALVPQLISLQERLPVMNAMLGPVLGSGVQLALEVAPDTAQVLVDPAELELALLNLAINARDAMPEGGTFRVSARNAVDDVPPMMAGPAVLVEAADDGRGIDPKILHKVFEPFFTTKPVGEGTGLGLSQVYGLCQRAHGTVTVASEPGKGTTVRMFFPATSKRLPDAAARAESDLPHLGISMLLVEDNDQVAFALKDILETLHCKVTRMDRGKAAYDWLARQEQLPDLMLSDIVMPGEMDGAALARRVRVEFPALKVILMTGHADQLESLSHQGFEILPKPCSAQVLSDAIRRAAGKSAGAGLPPASAPTTA